MYHVPTKKQLDMMDIKYQNKKKKNNCYFSLCIFVLLLFCCCEQKYNGLRISDGLETVLSDYIERYDTDSIIRVEFYKIKDHVNMLVFHEPYYDKNYVDGCFKKQGKLIVYHCDYEGLADSLIMPYNSINKDLLKKYKFWTLSDYDGNRDLCEYHILSKDKIIKNSKKNIIYNNSITNTDGIYSPAINKILNEKLNSNGSLVTSLHFASVKGKDYVCINSGRFYDYKNLYGCIIRDERMITLHSVDKISYKNIIDTSLIKKDLPILAKYKKIPKDDRALYLMFGDCYRILSTDSLIKITNNERLAYIICK